MLLLLLVQLFSFFVGLTISLFPPAPSPPSPVGLLVRRVPPSVSVYLSSKLEFLFPLFVSHPSLPSFPLRTLFLSLCLLFSPLRRVFLLPLVLQPLPLLPLSSFPRLSRSLSLASCLPSTVRSLSSLFSASTSPRRSLLGSGGSHFVDENFPIPSITFH